MSADLRQALELWPLLDEEQRSSAADKLRQGIVQMAIEHGARDQAEVRDLLEMFVAGAQAELDADEPTPMPQGNRAARRANRKRGR